jgi:hypothetical protein
VRSAPFLGRHALLPAKLHQASHLQDWAGGFSFGLVGTMLAMKRAFGGFYPSSKRSENFADRRERVALGADERRWITIHAQSKSGRQAVGEAVSIGVWRWLQRTALQWT